MKNFKLLYILFFVFSIELFSSSQYETVTTFAGSGTGGSTNGNGISAQFEYPANMVFDSQGNLFVSDRFSNAVRKITKNGDVTTFATGFNKPRGIAIDNNDTLYVSDETGNNVYKVTSAGTKTTIGTGFGSPTAVALDGNGVVYVADTSNNEIKTIELNGTIQTFASLPAQPYGLAFDQNETLYVTSSDNYLRKITTDGNVSVFAGDGTTTYLYNAHQLVFSSTGDIYLSDYSAHRVQVVDTNGTISTFAGTGTSGFNDSNLSTSQFTNPDGIAIDDQGNIFIAGGNHRIRKIANVAPNVNLNLSNVNLSEHNISNIQFIGTDDNNETLFIQEIFDGNISNGDNNYSIYVANYEQNTSFRIDTNDSGTLKSWWYNFTDLSIDTNNSGNDYKTEINATNYTFTIDLNASNWENSVPIIISSPDLNVSANSQYNYILQATDADSDTLTVGATTLPSWVSLISSPEVSTIAGNGTSSSIDSQGTNATFHGPIGVAVDSNGNIFVADTLSHKIRKIDTDGNVTTFAGSGTNDFLDGTATTAHFSWPAGITIAPDGTFYVAEEGNNRIRKILPSSTLTGTPSTTDVGFHDVNMSVSDGNNTVYQNFQVEVTGLYLLNSSLTFTGTTSLLDGMSIKGYILNESNSTTYANLGSTETNSTTSSYDYNKSFVLYDSAQSLELRLEYSPHNNSNIELILLDVNATEDINYTNSFDLSSVSIGVDDISKIDEISFYTSDGNYSGGIFLEDNITSMNYTYTVPIVNGDYSIKALYSDGNITYYDSVNSVWTTTSQTTTVSSDISLSNITSIPLSISPKLSLKAHGGVLQFDTENTNTSLKLDINQTLSSFTIEWWMNPASYVPSGNGIGDGLWGTFNFHDNGSGGLFVGISTERFTPTELPDATLELNEWQHFAFTFNADVNETNFFVLIKSSIQYSTIA